ncbi:MAG TPA: hypothetical protein VL463_15825 [Kofleriaceae bacterium]|nr:hypothetical protein [Kofleriaceae bacterium]
MRTAVIVALVLATAARANAAPLQKLTRDEVIRAGNAAAASLPPVDKTASAACKSKFDAAMTHPDIDAPTLAAAAACYRAAGALGAAITLWGQVLQRFPNTREAAGALHELGPAYELAGLYDNAADKDMDYANKYGGEPDALPRITRAICLWQQLGREDQLRRAYYSLKRWKKAPHDPATICDGIVPIVVPPPDAQAPAR